MFKQALFLALLALPVLAVAATPTINNCTPATTTDMTGQSSVAMQFGGALGFAYSTPCLHVTPGTTLMFSGAFASHPLVGGRIVGTTKVPDAASPIPATSTGSTKNFVLPAQGFFGYYCFNHGPIGMNGAILVGQETVFTDAFGD